MLYLTPIVSVKSPKKSLATYPIFKIHVTGNGQFIFFGLNNLRINMSPGAKME